MDNQGNVYLKTTTIRNTFNKRLFIRNVVIALAMCMVYILGMRYQSHHNPPANVLVKINSISKK